MQRRIVKTLVYRVGSIALAQSLSWILFRRIEFNAIVLMVDLIQTGYYYIFEKVWNEIEK